MMPKIQCKIANGKMLSTMIQIHCEMFKVVCEMVNMLSRRSRMVKIQGEMFKIMCKIVNMLRKIKIVKFSLPD